MIEISRIGPRATITALFAAFLVVSMFQGPAAVAANCDVKPDHPQCTGGGGGNGGSGGSCADSTSFPSFVYEIQPGEGQLLELWLSDAEGTCTQFLTEGGGGTCWFGDTKMQYTPPDEMAGENGKGRVVWYCWDDSSLVEFEVAQDNSLTVLGSMPIIRTDVGRLGDLDISSDGSSLAFSYEWPDTDGDGFADGQSLYIASTDDCMNSPWLDTDPSTCGGSESAGGSRREIFSEINDDPVNGAGARWWTAVNWNRDGTRLYLNQWFHVLISGPWIAEEDVPGGTWTFMPLANLGLGGDLASTRIKWDERPARETVAGPGPDPDGSPCGAIHIVDIDDCRADSDLCGNIGPDLLGLNPTFTHDNKLVFNQTAPQGKNRCRNNNKIAIVEPLDPGATGTQIVDGMNPDG